MTQDSRIPRLAALLIAASSVAIACSAAPASAYDGDWLRDQVRAARSGATIEVPAGDYDIKDLRITKDLRLVGPTGAEAIFRSAETTDKGLLIPTEGASLHVENITFRNTSSWDRNGAGIRHEGVNLDIVNCVFDSNEDGVLATGSPEGVITIKGSTFVDNGFGDGQSHGIYVFAADTLSITDSKFIGTRIGHHVKSLADKTIVANTLLDDAYGRTSYAIDTSKGGDVTIVNNTVIQSVDSDNSAIFNYDLTRGGAPVGIRIEGNKIINRYDGGRLLRNATRLEPTIANNTVTNEGRRPLKE